ncbi:hypothetical protein [Bombella saccharophila]|uniref:Polysaccharide chain length determinant N-terminal domain-containing protein n=1 Tax=Bombella saccharophila TaxID=2967338 RepID=A0ABT3WAE7_9PROT|nr:hypothetical protein [Bombella saccharophila]MCX5615319.1 hypothetical protein [Bombella saccharophila]PHI95478.1 hypothetical protein BG621_06920 [Parasaccharibacter apium]
METRTIFYKKKLFWWVCGGPSLIAAVYLFVWATPRYESTAILRVYEAGGQETSGGSAATEGLGGSMASPGAYVLTQYIASWDAFQALHPERLKEHWQNGDWPSSFGGPLTLFSSNQMRLWEYYKKHVTAQLDDISGLVTINVDGYSSDFSWTLNKDLLELARKELAESGIKSDQAEHNMLLQKIDLDKNSLSADLGKIAKLQKEAGISDLKGDYQVVLNSLAAAEKERISVDTRAAATEFLAARGQQIEALRIQLAALDKEIEHQRNDIAQKSAIYKEYGRIEAQAEQDTKLIMLDEESLLENERNAVRHAYYIDIIENPIHPTNATRPRALMWTLIILACSFAIYLIIK